MDSRYNHLDHEQKIYDLWETAGAFAVDTSNTTNDHQRSSRSFSIIMPPPNANDPLHIGHAMFIALEDVLIRFHRMLGEDTVWVPGTDHAGIETQFVFEKKLAKQGQSRFQFDRQTLYKMIWDYVQENSGVAVNQMKKLGASADWSRYTFTLDSDVVNFVTQTFSKLYDDQLIYRDLRLVNYCTKCGTSYSELEVNHQEQTTKLYYMKYGPFTLATTRPETKFGDTAVAVHPDDKRYQQYIGQEIEVEGLLGSFKIKVIADEYVDPEFGTGVVKITPYHDFNDFEVWQRHKDELPEPKQVIGYDGKLNEVAGKYAGLRIKAAREVVEKDLQEKGLLVKVDDKYTHSIGTCYRCGTVIEPLPLPQFFIKVKPLAEKALEAIAKGEVKIHGTGRDKILINWLENLKDWNISRQIVWGIRIPVWYSMAENPEMQLTYLDDDKQLVKVLAKNIKQNQLETVKNGLQHLLAPTGAKFVVSDTSPGEEYFQETDTFDTWFSSGQWPVVTLKTNQPGDFERFYPTTVMETGYDILPFWVMRMLLLGLYLTGQVPFKHVYLHGLVRDQKGQKMSKSKGNVINPLTIVEQYGADALRMALVIRSTPGLDKSIGDNDFRAMRNLTNKIWNATRFVKTLSENPTNTSQNAPENEAFQAKLAQVTLDITNQLQDYKIGLAADTVYNEFWHWFCDVCIEKAKSGEISLDVLTHGLAVFLKLLHPFVPYVTEAAWSELFDQKPEEMLISSPWPLTTN